MRHAPPPIDAATARIHRVLDYIQANLAGDLSLDELAEVAALSRFHFHRVFHGVMGATVAQTVRGIRLHCAAARLVQSDEPLAQISADCGYPNPDSFGRVFADHFGLTPAAYRRRGVVRLPIDPTFPKETSDMPDVEIRQMPEIRLAALEHRGPYPEVSATFNKLIAAIGPANLWPKVGGLVMVCFDDPSQVPAEELRSLAAASISGDAELPAPLQEHVIPAADTAVMLHKGPYSGLAASYDILYGQWLPASGRIPGEHASWEKYLNSPMDTAPDDLLTEICLPLAPT